MRVRIQLLTWYITKNTKNAVNINATIYANAANVKAIF